MSLYRIDENGIKVYRAGRSSDKRELEIFLKYDKDTNGLRKKVMFRERRLASQSNKEYDDNRTVLRRVLEGIREDFKRSDYGLENLMKGEEPPLKYTVSAIIFLVGLMAASVIVGDIRNSVDSEDNQIVDTQED